MSRIRIAATIALLCALLVGSPTILAAAASVPFWGANASSPADTPIESLRHGEFIWFGNVAPSGPVVVVVSLTEQRGYVYRNGVLIGVTTVSTGRPGYETPTGVFAILQKDKDHRSSIYDNAPMPYMQRLTWDGVALHAGGLPGYPESHGCVHLPSEFARRLFEISPPGMTVVVANETSEPEQVVHPRFLAPVSPATGKPVPVVPVPGDPLLLWDPAASANGPVSIVLSRRSARVAVYRNGIEIGHAPVTISGDAPIGTHALILTDGERDASSRFVPPQSRYRWMRIGLPGHLGEAGGEPDPAALARIRIPQTFVDHVFSVLTPGATVLATDAAMTSETTGGRLDVLNADPGAATPTAERNR